MRFHSLRLVFSYFFFVVGVFSNFSISLFAGEREGFRFLEEEKTITLHDSGGPVWVYHFGLNTREELPQSERRRTRGTYIHPLYGLNGEILTEDFPRDHYHHHGVFWTWPYVGVHRKHNGEDIPAGEMGEKIDRYDLWEDIGIQQRFVKWGDRKIDPHSATLSVENGWFAGGEKLMIEKIEIKTHRIEEGGNDLKTRAVDFHFCWIPTEFPITLKGAPEKSYGGFTVRFRPHPNPKEGEKITTITIPSGIADRDLPETPLPWADFTSRFGTGERRSGAAIFVPKDHPDYPPTWLTRYYGPLCVGWPGVNGRTFPPGEEIRVHYRIWIHDNEVNASQIQKAYENYTLEP